MSDKPECILGPDIDLDTEEVLEPDGTRLTEAPRPRARRADTPRGPSRPSLTGPGKRSPRVSFRLPADELRAAQERAKREGIPLSELARRALEELIRRAS